MKKKPKPKSVGCRWKVLWTFLFGFLLFGATNARAYTMTFIFHLTPTQLENLEILDDGGDPANLNIDSNGEAVVNYTAGATYYIGPIGSNWTVDCTNDIVAGSHPFMPGYAVFTLQAKNNDGTVTITSPEYGATTDPDPDPADGSYINLNFGGVNDAYQYAYLINNTEYSEDFEQAYTTNENPTKWTYAFNKDGVAGVILTTQKGYRISSITCTNSSLVNANQEDGGDYYIQDASGASGFSLAPATSPNYSGAWYIDVYNDKVSGSTFVITIEKASDPVYFTIETTDAVKEALKDLDEQVAIPSYTVFPTNLNLRQNVDIYGDSFTYYYMEGLPTPLQVAITPNLEPGKDFEIVVTSTDLPVGSNTYTVDYTRGRLGNAVATINLNDGCINGNFVIKVQKVGESVEPEPANEIELDKTYTVDASSIFEGTIDITEEGTLGVTVGYQANGQGDPILKDANGNEIEYISKTANDEGTVPGWMYSFPVNEGTYSFTIDNSYFLSNAFEIYFEMVKEDETDKPVEITGMLEWDTPYELPARSIISYATLPKPVADGFITVNGDPTVQGTMFIGGSEVEPIETTANTATYNVGAGNEVMYFAAIETPTTLTFTFTETPKLVTFAVAGENYSKLQYAVLTLEEFMDDDPTSIALQPMTSSSFDVVLGEGNGATNFVILQPANGYDMTVESDVPEYAGQGAYTWQNMSIMLSDVDAEPKVLLGLGAGAASAKFDITLTEIVESIPALVADDFDMTFTKGQTRPVTTDVYVSLENIENMYSYAGYQFDITLPFGMEVIQAALGTGIVGMEGYEKPISVAQVNDMPPTTYRVLGFFEPTTATENIAKLTISGVYNEDMVNGEESPVTIQNSVVFASPTGGDKTDIAGSASTVTIYIDENLAEKVTIESCKLLWPSYTSREGDIEYITEGQAVELTAVLEPMDATDEITWTATVNGSDNLGVQVIVNSDDNPNNLVAQVSTTWELLNLQSPITVVIKAQAESDDVYAEYELTVNPIVLGDANDNEVVNVADVVTTANYLANGGNQTTIADFVAEFDLPNADVILSDNEAPGNVNGITVSDVTAIVNIALDTFNGERNPIKVRRHVNTYRSNDRLVAARVSDSSIAVALDGQTAYAALQVEIEMPAGMSVYGVEKGARAAGHELTYGVNASGNVVVVLYSLDNSSFAGEGSLFTLQVEGGNAEDMRLVNVFASDSQSNGYELEGLYSGEVTGIFGIDAELASGVRYFTVDGVQVTNPEKGQILIRVAGNKVEKTIIK